jgi:hypothetical protein
MEKLELFVVKPDDEEELIYKKLMTYLNKQGIKIVKEVKNEE